MIKDLENFVAAHSATLAVAGGWIIHVFLPDIRAAFPYLKANGGVFGVVKAFFCGESKPLIQPPTQ